MRLKLFSSKIPLALPIFTSSIWLRKASSSSNHFHRRDFCDILFCLPDLWGTAGALFDEYISPYSQPENGQSPTKTPSQNSDIEINVSAPPLLPEECAPADINDGGDRGNAIPGSCLQTSQATVWPINCGDELQNKEMAKILAGMDPNFLTSVNPMCAVKEGVLF